jgi:hypothetical protein
MSVRGRDFTWCPFLFLSEPVKFNTQLVPSLLVLVDQLEEVSDDVGFAIIRPEERYGFVMTQGYLRI